MTAYLFDIDGVLTDPVEKRVTEENLYSEIIKRLQRKDKICFNTGRSTAWITKRVVIPLLKQVSDKNIFGNFFVIGEKGGTWITFDKDGNMIHGRKESFFLSPEFANKIKTLVEKEYSDSMFFDTTKETMISIEMHDGFALAEFHR